LSVDNKWLDGRITCRPVVATLCCLYSLMYLCRLHSRCRHAMATARAFGRCGRDVVMRSRLGLRRPTNPLISDAAADNRRETPIGSTIRPVSICERTFYPPPPVHLLPDLSPWKSPSGTSVRAIRFRVRGLVLGLRLAALGSSNGWRNKENTFLTVYY